MKGFIFNEKLELRSDLPLPLPAVGEALIKVLFAGICNTDIEITKGYMGFKGIPGHEFVGIVEDVNGSDKSLIGKRVVGDINCACGKDDCEYCSRDLGRHCPERTTLGIYKRDGCLCEYAALPKKNLLEVPENIPSEIAALTEPLAAGFEILEQINITESTEIMILGDGKLGLLINHALSTTGAKITHVGKHPEKLKLVEKNGCSIMKLEDLPDKRFDMVVEATGSVSGFELSVAHTKPRGIMVLKSTIASERKIDLTQVVIDEITIVGSRCSLFQPAIDYMETGVDLRPLISGVYPIDDGLSAFEEAKRKGSLKVLIDFR